MSKTLVTFFSRADENFFGGEIKTASVGNTKIAVDFIKEMADVDVFEIKMKNPYSANYNICTSEARSDQKNNARPELAENIASLAEYDKIIMAYPNYWGTIPMVMFTFLESHDFAGKTIYPLCTNEGSGMGHSEVDIKRLSRGANIVRGLSIIGSAVKDSKPQIQEWLKNNNLI